MTALAIGASITVAVRDGGTVAIATNGGFGTVTSTPAVGAAVTTSFGPEPVRRVFGPYSEGASVTVTNNSCNAFDYDAETSSGVPFDPASVAITGGTIGGRVVAEIAAAVAPSLNDYSASNPMYVAHRGSAGLYPEESTVAYNRTLADGEYLLECDVQTLSDGSLGLMHDGTVDRTTTGTGNVNTFSAATFKALTMDSSAWLGSNYGDTLNPMMFQDFIEAYKTRAILVPEDKDFLSMTALVRALINAGVPFDRALVQTFTAADLATAVNAGYRAIGLSSAGNPTAAAIAATGATWAGIAAGDSIASFLSAGLKVLFYTVNRRNLRDTYLAQGASGFFSDDPVYLRSSVAASKTDFFARQTWVPGMLGNGDSFGLGLPNRGVFSAPNYWGYSSATTPTTYIGCLMGFLCPVASPSNFTFTFKLTMDTLNAGDVTRWASLFIGTSDAQYVDGTEATSGYHLLMRGNGTLQIFRKDSGIAASLLQQQTASNLTLGTEYTFTVTVTPTAITLANTTLGTSVTTSDTTYRGGYLHLGRAGLACRYRTLNVS